MIGLALVKMGVPRWLAWIVFAAAIGGGALWYRAALIEQGVTQESTRRDGLDAIASAHATATQAGLNRQVAALQARLVTTAAELEKTKQEFDHEKIVSSQRQSDLLAGAVRLRILTRARAPAQTGQAEGAAAAGLDPQPGVEVDIDGRSAAWIDGLRTDRNALAVRLDACVVAYDALAAAVNEQP